MRWYWIDRFLEFQSGNYAKSIKNITLAEDHLHDHFPGYPVIPRSLVVEGVAQTGGLLVCEHSGLTEKVVLAKISRATFYSEAVPGDSLVYTATIQSIHKDGAMVTATSYKGDELHADLELFFAHLDEEFANRTLIEPRMLLHMMRILRVYEVGRTADGEPLEAPDLASLMPDHDAAE